jgi:hypothetical protein
VSALPCVRGRSRRSRRVRSRCARVSTSARSGLLLALSLGRNDLQRMRVSDLFEVRFSVPTRFGRAATQTILTRHAIRRYHRAPAKCSITWYNPHRALHQRHVRNSHLRKGMNTNFFCESVPLEVFAQIFDVPNVVMKVIALLSTYFS